jgi:hypothetical protein
MLNCNFNFMEMSKIHLSPSEAELMQNAAIILTKNSVLEKIRNLLEDVQDRQLAFVHQNGLQTIDPFFISPKISKGENYRGLPYIILDYPRTSTEKNFFFIRSMFWWGHYFSSTLHLSGNYKTTFLDSIKSSYDFLKDYYIGISNDQWAHHFEQSNYTSISALSENEFQQQCAAFEYIKIAMNCPLDKWDKAPAQLFANWQSLLNVCGLIS